MASKSEEVPMPIPNMETCVFGIQVLNLDAQRRLKEFKAVLDDPTHEESDLAPFEKKLRVMELQFSDWKQKFVTAVAALKDYKKLYSTHIQEFNAVEDIFDQGTKALINAKNVFVNQADRQKTISRNHAQNFKLERIKLPTFDGMYSAWPEFHDLFTSAVDNSTSYSQAEKMVYLRTLLTGDALAIIQSFPTTADSYKDAWDLVKKRFNNPREIAFSHLRKLYELRRATDSAHDLRQVVDLVNELVRSLKSQKIPVEHWDVIIIFWTLKKLDDETRKEWLLSQDVDLPTLDPFLEFIEKRACALDDSLARPKKPINPAQEQKKEVKSKSSIDGRSVFATSVVAPSTSTASTSARVSRGLCVCCQTPYHPLNMCGKFATLSPTERSEIIRTAHLCFNCFSSKHAANACPSKFSCRVCERKHHTLLHVESSRGPTTQSQQVHSFHANTNPSAGGTPPLECLFGSGHTHNVLLATIQVNVLDSKGRPHLARVFVDNGSEVEFVSSNLAHRLSLKTYGTPIKVTGISGVPGPPTHGKVKLTLCSRFNSFSLPIEADVVDKLTNGNLPQYKCQHTFPHLNGIQLADPHFSKPQPVDILLGNRFATRIKTGGLIHGPSGTPSAEDTPFGWILSGEFSPGTAPHPHSGPTVANVRVSRDPPLLPTAHTQAQSLETIPQSSASEPALDELFKNFCRSEDPDPPRIPRTTEDSICESIFCLTTTRDPTGRYVVSLPFRQNHTPLGKSFSIAMRRFHGVERRIHLNENIRQAYLDYFRNGLATGIMEIIPPAEIPISPAKSYYMPFTHVVKESSTSTKTRIVFDCSARTVGGQSLNEILYPGPKLQVDLVSLLIRFRTFPYVMSADITKFFTQIWVDSKHKDFQRLLFREAPGMAIQHLRFRRVTFGLSPAPYLSIRTLHKLFEEECTDPCITELIKSDLLVDNVLTGAFSIAEALHIQDVLRATMAKGHFPLCKWASNTDSLLSSIPQGEREVVSPLLITDPDGLPTLGLRWNPSADTLSVLIPDLDTIIPNTKRSILSAVAKLYDPLGWLSPVSIRAKILLQDIWKAKSDWDEPVPQLIAQKWMSYTSDLQLMKNLVFPRGYFPQTDEEGVTYQVFGFSDGSNSACAAVVYLRRISPSDVSISLVGSKTKVIPVKGDTTPRVELNGAKILSKYVKTVVSALPIQVESIHCYTDSTSVLGWINSTKSAQKREVFVLNRVRTIQQALPTSSWNFVKGTENPADAPTRGISASEFKSHPLWFQGPPWLKTLRITPPATTSQAVVVPVSPLMSFIMGTSSLQRMKTFVASGRRILRNAFSKPKDTSPLTATELEEAFMVIVKEVQQEAFPEDIRLLKSNRSPAMKKIKFLAPFIDEHGLLRVGGRLSQSNRSFEMKHPLLLPKKHHFTEVLIRYLHVKHLHAGATLLLCILREQFWIFDGPTTVKNIVRRCVLCHRHKPVPLQQLMGPLPNYRVNPCPRPFVTTAIDYAGVYTLATAIGRNPRLQKHYFCVFVCTATKAVHLELAGDLSTPTFIAALIRFVSRRGIPRVIVSDGGLNFVGAKNELDALLEIINSPKFQEDVIIYATECGIDFRFNPPLGPHHGGLFESAVKSAKFHLKRIIGDRHLSIEEFGTLLTQVEAALNSRPLLPLSSDPSDFRALTPAHFLIGDTLHSIPSEDFTEVKVNRLKRWEVVQQFSQHFWKRFVQEYLSTLQSRPKWIEPIPNIEPGTLVLVQESDAAFSSHKWNLARVTAVYPGSDGKVRVVDIKTPQGKIFRRPTSRIAPIPIEHQPVLEADPGPTLSVPPPPGRCSGGKVVF